MNMRRLQLKVLVSLDEVDDERMEVSSYRFWSDKEKLARHVHADGTLDFTSLHESVDIEFEIANNVKGRRFALPSSGGEAVWLSEGACCPTGANESFGQIGISKAENEERNLVLHNYNEKREEIGYLLRFQDLASSAIYRLDPVIKNGGGGRRGTG